MPAKIECMTYPKNPRKRRGRRSYWKRNSVEKASRKVKQGQRTGRRNSALHSTRKTYR